MTSTTNSLKTNKIYSVTGHRPDKLGGYGRKVFQRLVDLSTQILQIRKAGKVYIGMAIGFDMAMAMACFNLGIKYVACVPFKGQEKLWQPAQIELYWFLVENAFEIEIVSEGGYSPVKMEIRNRFMTDRARNGVLTLWNGSKGGTGNCVAYAKSIGKPIFNYWSSWEKYKNL